MLRATYVWSTAFICAMSAYSSARAQLPDLYSLSLDELINIKVSTASRSLESLDQAPATIYVVTAADIRRYGYVTLKDILSNIPGLQIVNLDFFAVGGQRGFLGNFSQTLLLVNGREMQNLIAAEAFINDQFATNNISRVEVLNGPGSALYGANALVGIINIVTKNDDTLYQGAEVNLEAGTENTRAASIVFGKTLGQVRISGNARKALANGWDYSDAVADTTHFSDGSAPIVQKASADYAGTYNNQRVAKPYSLKLEWSDFYLGREAFSLESGKGIENVALRYDLQTDERKFKLGYVGWQYEAETGLRLKIENQRYREQFWGRNNNYDSAIFEALVSEGRNPDSPLTLDEIHDDFTLVYSQRGSGGSYLERTLAEMQIDVQQDSELIAGVEYAEKDLYGVAIAHEDAIPPFDTRLDENNPLHSPTYQTDSSSLYLQLKTPVLDVAALTLGSRWDHQSLYGTVNTVRGGLVWPQSTDTTYKLLYGEAFREPTIFEAGPSPNTAKQLNPAQIKTWELAAAHSFSTHVRAQSTVFISSAKDLIEPGSTVDFENSNKTVTNRGIENTLQLEIEKLQGDLAYIYIDPQNRTIGDKKIDALNVYQHRFMAGLAYPVVEYWTLAMRANYFSQLDAEHGNSSVDQIISINSAKQLEITASFQYTLSDQHSVDGFIAIKNALDAEWYQPNVRNTGPREYLQPGRTLLTRINVHF